MPKDEHSKIGSAERAIDQIYRMVAASLVGEHCSLLNAVTQSCPTDHGITIYEAETGLIPDLDVLPPLGCFSVRYLSKMDRIDSICYETGLITTRVNVFSMTKVGRPGRSCLMDCRQ